MIAQGEFRFRAYEDAGGNTRTGTSFVASRLGPDILLADVTVTRRSREAETGRTREVTQDAAPATQPSPAANPDATRAGMPAVTAHRVTEAPAPSFLPQNRRVSGSSSAVHPRHVPAGTAGDVGRSE